MAVNAGSYTDGPYVCPDCRKRQMNWNSPCPHYPRRGTQRLAKNIVADLEMRFPELSEGSRLAEDVVAAVLAQEVQQTLIDADSELSAIGHSRPADKEECKRVSHACRKLYEGER